MMTPAIVPVADVDAVWPLVSDSFVKCLEKTPSYFSAGEAWQQCRSGNALLIVIHDEERVLCASVWEFKPVCGRSAFNCQLWAGERTGEWFELFVQFVTDVAKLGGAEVLTGTGRIGLVRRLKSKLAGLKITRASYLVEI